MFNSICPVRSQQLDNRSRVNQRPTHGSASGVLIARGSGQTPGQGIGAIIPARGAVDRVLIVFTFCGRGWGDGYRRGTVNLVARG
jgi:hypothetical protein